MRYRETIFKNISSVLSGFLPSNILKSMLLSLRPCTVWYMGSNLTRSAIVREKPTVIFLGLFRHFVPRNDTLLMFQSYFFDNNSYFNLNTYSFRFRINSQETPVLAFKYISHAYRNFKKGLFLFGPAVSLGGKEVFGFII